MTLDGRLRQMVTALPNEASIILPVALVREWLDDEGDDLLADLAVAQVAARLGRSEGTVRLWIRSGAHDAYTLGREYRVTRSTLAAFRLRRRNQPTTCLSKSSRWTNLTVTGWQTSHICQHVAGGFT